MCDLCTWLATLPADAPGAIDYSRVSEEEKDGKRAREKRRGSTEARSVRQQADDNRAVCHDNHWRHLRSYSDTDISASRFEKRGRPGWARLLKDISDPAVHIIVLWESSRGDRKPGTWIAFLDQCRDLGKLIHVTTHERTYDVRRWRDYQTLAEEGLASAGESEKTSRRVLRDMADAARAGVPHGAAPYGYRRIYDPLTRESLGWEINPDTAPIVRLIIGWTAEGVPVSWQTAELTRRSIPSPRDRAWSNFTVRMIATNPVYIAKRRWHLEPGRLFDGNWAAIIDDEATYWDAVTVADSRKKGGRHDGAAKWLLSLIATCGECGAPLVSRAGGTPTARRVYTCNGSRSDIYTTRRGCTSIVAEWADTWVEERVKTRLAREDIYDQLAAPDHSASATARGRATALRSQLDEARTAVGNLTMTITSFTQIEATLVPAIAAADREARALSLPPVLRNLAGHPRDHIDQVWAGMPVAAQRDIIRALLDHAKLIRATGADRHSHKFNPARIKMRWTGDTEDS